MADLSPSALQRLAQEDSVWLAVVRPDGSPHLTPVWFLYEEETSDLWR